MAIAFGPGESELTSLKSVEDGDIMANTEARYNEGFIYTRSGRLLLAVNPYRALPLYSPQVLQAYKESLQPQAELPPHVYAVAASAHLGMMQNSMSQVRGVAARRGQAAGRAASCARACRVPAAMGGPTARPRREPRRVLAPLKPRPPAPRSHDTRGARGAGRRAMRAPGGRLA